MDIKRTTGGLPPLDSGNETGKATGAGKTEPFKLDRPSEARPAGRANAQETEDLARMKAAVTGYTARDLNDPVKTKEVVEKVAKELVETGTRSMPGLTGKQKADLAKFAENDPVMSSKILSFVREQVG